MAMASEATRAQPRLSKRQRRGDSAERRWGIPEVAGGVGVVAFLSEFARKQAVVFRREDGAAAVGAGAASALGLHDFVDLFEACSPASKATFGMESKGDGDVDAGSSLASLASAGSGVGQQWYCSFILKEGLPKECKAAEKFSELELPVSGADSSQIRYGDSLWVFVGRNMCEAKPLEGRKLHTDDISHSGTFHVQVSGRKRWRLVPTQELRKTRLSCDADKAEGGADEDDAGVVVECGPGDVLFLSTKLWWHATELPCTADAADAVSISYARDVFLAPFPDDVEEPSDLTNVEGLYAAADIEVDTIVLTESHLPDSEMPRGSPDQANCAVVELESGEMAVVSKKRIRAGEWFVLPESDDDDDDDNDDDNDDDDDDDDDDDASDPKE